MANAAGATVSPRIRLHRLDGTAGDLRTFVIDSLRQNSGTWVSGIHGAVAEFSIGSDEAVDLDVDGRDVTAATARGGIVFRLTEDVRALAFGSRPDPAASIIVLALPRERVPSVAARGLTSLGRDIEAIKPADREERLYDLGLGSAAGGFGIRTARPELIAALDRCLGWRWPELLASVGADLLRASPTRVVRNPIGRVEVATPIPPPGGLSPAGPHTHLLPDLLAVGGDVPPALALPDAFLPCAIFYPAGVQLLADRP